MVATPAATATGDAAIWNFLKNKGLNDCAVAGVMGNLFAESGLNPKNLQNTYEKSLGYTDDGYTAAVDSGKYTNFVKDSAGYGLAQWTYWSRKQGLLDAAKAAKTSIGDLTTQLNYLWKELQSYGLISALSSSTTVLSASNVILLQFEKPADQSAAAQTKRASYGQGYYTKFAGKSGAVAAPTSYPQISKGATGEIVKILQNALNSKYGYKLAIDGSFGPATDAAVRNLQKSFGLAVDGVVGKNTWGKLVDV
jgi:murein L,D-transpeptidase YcbB/YkuD